MSLWSITRSPLMFGGDMTKMDDYTFSLISNKEVLAMNIDSTNNAQLFRKNADFEEDMTVVNLISCDGSSAQKWNIS